MRYFLISLCLPLLLVMPINAQDDACDTLICHIETDWQDFNYATGCEYVSDCTYENFQLYQLAVALELSATCELDDIFCRNQAFLYSMTTDVYANPLADLYGWIPPNSEVFTQAIGAFSNQDYDDALGLLQVDNFEYQNEMVVTFSRGLVYEMLDRPHDAFQAYESVLSYDNHQLLTIYTQALLLGRLGHNEEASFTSAQLQDYITAFAPDLLYLIEELISRFPLDETRTTSWLRYSVSRREVSPMGVSVFDLTQSDPVPVQLSFYDEIDAIVAVDVSNLRYANSLDDIFNTYVLRENENAQYIYTFVGTEWEGDLGYLSLEHDNGLWQGEELSSIGEGFTTETFILAPLDAPNPREGFGEPACEGGVISRLRSGMRVVDAGYFYYAETAGGRIDPNLYFDDGYRGDMTDFSTYPTLIIRVTDNNICIGNELWWEVSDGQGNTGWRPENIGNEYRLYSPDFSE